MMYKILFVALVLVLSSTLVGTFVADQAEAVGEGCPSKDGNTNSATNQPTPQPISTEFSTTQII